MICVLVCDDLIKDCCKWMVVIVLDVFSRSGVVEVFGL